MFSILSAAWTKQEIPRSCSFCRALIKNQQNNKEFSALEAERFVGHFPESIKNLHRNWFSFSRARSFYFTFGCLASRANFDTSFRSLVLMSTNWCCPCLASLFSAILCFQSIFNVTKTVFVVPLSFTLNWTPDSLLVTKRNSLLVTKRKALEKFSINEMILIFPMKEKLFPHH